MSIGEAEVRRVAALARLRLEDEEVGHLVEDLGRILDYVGKLGELDTGGVEPTAQVASTEAAFREDAVTSASDPEAAVANAPRADEHYFAVPRIIE